MSYDLNVYTDEPLADKLDEFIENSDLKTTESFNLESADGGVLPLSWRSKAVAIQCHVNKMTAEDCQDLELPQTYDLEICLSAGADMNSLIAQSELAAVLVKKLDGLLYDPQEDESVDVKSISSWLEKIQKQHLGDGKKPFWKFW